MFSKVAPPIYTPSHMLFLQSDNSRLPLTGEVISSLLDLWLS